MYGEAFKTPSGGIVAYSPGALIPDEVRGSGGGGYPRGHRAPGDRISG